MEKKYFTKSAREFADSLSFSYQKPNTCPHCGYGTDAPIRYKSTHPFNSQTLLVAVCECTSCNKNFFFAAWREKSDGLAECRCIYPSISAAPFLNANLQNISERFIDMYNQALTAEFNGHYELAAIGFRSSLEILIKDYAINELNRPESEVEGKNLFSAISEYLSQDTLIKTADVIRILGNDYAHYKRKYPEHDFVLLKGYMDIFLKQVEVLYMVNHPPVARTQE